MTTPFRQVIQKGDVGSDVKAVKRAGKKINAQGSKQVVINKTAGDSFIHMLDAVAHNHGMTPDHKYGPKLHAIFAPHFDAYGVSLYKSARIRKRHPKQDPALPHIWPVSVFRIDNGGFNGKWGIHPALVPQVEAICKYFNLEVTAGYGGHPPHATLSDHRVGLAVDLAGDLRDMQRCNLWADGLRGKVFRWVGGPAHDADGVEVGHYTHDHLSWYRTHPTTIFGVSALFS